MICRQIVANFYVFMSLGLGFHPYKLQACKSQIIYKCQNFIIKIAHYIPELFVPELALNISLSEKD